MSELIKTNNISFKNYEQHCGKYRFLKLSMNNQAGNTVTMDAVSNFLVEFKLPAQVYNLSKSYLSYQIEIPGVASTCNWVFNDTVGEFQSLTFGSGGGLNFADVQYLNNYLSVARKYDINNDDYLSADVTSGLQKADLTSTNYFPPSVTTLAGNLFNGTASTVKTALTGLEPAYTRSSPALNTSLVVQRTFPLGAVSGTLLSMPQDQYFGNDNMFLRFMTAQSGKVGFTSTSITDPTAGPAVFTTQPIIKNLYLFLAVEKDNLICESMVQKFNSGSLKYTVPYTYVNRISSVGAGSQAIQVLLNGQQGKRLKRVMYSAFPASETLNVAYDHSNFNGSKIVSYQTFIDSQPLQDAVISCVYPSAGVSSSLDDYRENHAFINRSGAILNPSAFQYNWMNADVFAQPSADPLIPDSSIIDGIDLSVAKTYAVMATTTASNFTHYVWSQVIRALAVTPQGVMWE